MKFTYFGKYAGTPPMIRSVSSSVSASLSLLVIVLIAAACGGLNRDSSASAVDAAAAPPTDIPVTQEGVELNPTSTPPPTVNPDLPNEIVNSAETFAVRYPDGWNVLDVSGTLKFANTAEVAFVLPSTFAEGDFYAALDVIPFDVSGMSGAAPADFLERTALSRGGVALRLGEAESLTLGTLEAAVATGTYTLGATRLDVLYVVVIEGEAFGVLELYTAADALDAHVDDARSLMETFRYTPIPGARPESTPDATAEATDPATAEATPGS